MRPGEFTITKSYEPDMECMVKALKVVLNSKGISKIEKCKQVQETH